MAPLWALLPDRGSNCMNSCGMHEAGYGIRDAEGESPSWAIGQGLRQPGSLFSLLCLSWKNGPSKTSESPEPTFMSAASETKAHRLLSTLLSAPCLVSVWNGQELPLLAYIVAGPCSGCSIAPSLKFKFLSLLVFWASTQCPCLCAEVPSSRLKISGQI